MIDQKPQAKIPVKKADGTTVFLTMEEFREYKKKSAASAPATPPPAPVTPPNISFDDTPSEPQKPVPSTPPSPKRTPKKLEQGKVEKIEPPVPMVQNTDTELATTTPVKDIFVDQAKVQAPLPPESKPEPQPEPIVEPTPEPEPTVEEVPLPPPPVAVPVKSEWKSADNSSLLEEDITQEQKILPPPPVAQDNASALLATVKSQFPFPLSKEIEGRFDSLVLSRIRDVRTPLDFEQYAKMSIKDGGLGMEEDQVRLLSAVITAAQKISGSIAPSATPAAKSQPPVSPIRTAPPITPVNITAAPPKPRIPLPPEPAEYSFTPPKSQVPSGATGKPMVQDVTMPPNQRRTMGPVDEIQNFSLVDFRRLSPKTESAKEILKGKFQNLQEESYVLFLDARDAWHESPLFKVYQDTVLEALNTKHPLPDVLGQNPNGLTPDELNSIIEINHYLG